MSSTNISSLSSTLIYLQNKMSFGFGITYLIFGVTGNFFNILLFYRQQFRTVSCCTYFLAASVAMFIALSITGGSAIYSAYNRNPLYYISAYCKIWYYLVQSSTMTYRWLMITSCLDRYACTSASVRLRGLASVHIARRVVAILVLLWILFPSPILVLYDIRAGNCIIVYGYAAGLYNTIFTMFNTCIAPLSIMITCALLIRRNLAAKRTRRRNNAGQQQIANNREHLHRKRDQQALIMLFVQIIIYIILTTPWVIVTVYNNISANVPNKSNDRLNIERFAMNLVGSMTQLFPTTSFYLYTLTSSMFRKELFIMLRSIVCRKFRVNNRRIDTITIRDTTT